MQAITTIGLDIAKSVFQVHGDESVKSQVLRLCGKAAGSECLSRATLSTPDHRDA